MLKKLKAKKDALKEAGKTTLTAAEVRAARVEEDKSAWQWGYLAEFDERPQVPLEGYFRHPCPDDLLPGPFAWFGPLCTSDYHHWDPQPLQHLETMKLFVYMLVSHFYKC